MKTLIAICAFALPISLSAQLRMESNGNIGIGTTTPSSRLEVNNGDLTIKAGASTATDPGDLVFRSATGAEYGRMFAFPDALRFRSNSNSAGSLNIMNPTGNVAIQMNNASSNYSLDIFGQARANFILLTSDQRFKSNIVQLPSSRTSNLYQLSGYTYDFSLSDYARICNKSESDEDKTNYDEIMSIASIGIIAQEVKEFYPELVQADDNGYLSVNYDGLIPILIEALKEQKVEIDELKDNLSNLISNAEESTVTKVSANLGQNVPNPFSDVTEVSYNITDPFSRASINVYDLTGALKLTINVEDAQGKVSINGSDLYKGLFIYNLVVDGREVASKKMIIQ